jgi:DNA-binding SARP family transcriptional activator
VLDFGLLGSLQRATSQGQVPSARNTAHSHIKRLRKLLRPADGIRVLTREPGYLAEIWHSELDLHEFVRLHDAGRAEAVARNWAQAAGLLRESLTFWRGEPLSDVPSAFLHRNEVPRLAELRAQALNWRIDADLHCGRHEAVIAELRQLVAVNPLREHLWAQLLLALYRSGRQADALAGYQQAREVLREELGIDSGQELRKLHQRILVADPALAGVPVPIPGTTTSAAQPTTRPVPGEPRAAAAG